MKNAVVETPETYTGTAKVMPLYQSHKKVWALKVAKFEPQSEQGMVGGYITPAEAGYARFAVSSEYVQKHNPKEGGYFVQYEDGYCSWSPAEAFEGGYTRIA